MGSTANTVVSAGTAGIIGNGGGIGAAPGSVRGGVGLTPDRNLGPIGTKLGSRAVNPVVAGVPNVPNQPAEYVPTYNVGTPSQSSTLSSKTKPAAAAFGAPIQAFQNVPGGKTMLGT